MPIVAAFTLLAVLGVALLVVRKSAGTASVADACRDLQREIESGGETDPAKRQRKIDQLRSCTADLAAQGIAVDLSSIALGNARATASLLDLQWGDYRGTDYADTVRRGNIRNNMGRLQDQLRDQLSEAARNATTLEGRAKVREEIQRQIVASLDRAQCYQSGAQGCGRSGIIEGDWDERTRDEIQHGALALGLRTAVETGWRTPRDRGDPADNYQWGAWNRSQASGNVVPAMLYRVGELERVLAPSWDDFGGGPHYPGQRDAIQATWTAGTSGTSPYDIVGPPPNIAAAVRRGGLRGAPLLRF